MNLGKISTADCFDNDFTSEDEFWWQRKCLYNDSYGSQYLLLMQWRHRKPWGFLLSYQNYLFWGERGHATLFPWQDWTQDPAQSGHTLDYHDNVRSLLFSSLYTVAYQKKKHSQHVLILSFYKQDTGWLSNSNNFYSQSICIWFKYLSLECKWQGPFPLPRSRGQIWPEGGEHWTGAVGWDRIYCVMIQ